MYQDCERWLRFWINIDKIWDNIVWSKRVVAKVEMSPSLPSPPSTSYFGSARKERCKEGVRIGKLWPIFSILHRRLDIISPFWRLIHHQHRNDEGEMSSSISSPPSTLYSGSARKERCKEGVRIGKLWPIFSILHRRLDIISPFWRLIHHQHRNDEGEMSTSISSPPSTLYSGFSSK